MSQNIKCFILLGLILSVALLRVFYLTMQDGEVWTFSVRTFDAAQPERTINVNYEGFAEGK